MTDPLTQVTEQLLPLLRGRQVLAIGELHGTVQFPSLIGRLVAAAADRELSVTVGLEIPCSERPGEFGPFWQRLPMFQDGRSSMAMADLVGGLVEPRNRGADVEVVFMDGPWVAPGSPIPMEWLHLVEQRRDEVMASFLLDAMGRRAQAVTLVLAGSQHTRVDGSSLDGEGRPALGHYLRRWHPEMVSLLGQTSGGEAWTISGRSEPGRPRPVAHDADLEPGAAWATRPGTDGHHGYVHVGPVTASPPHPSGGGR